MTITFDSAAGGIDAGATITFALTVGNHSDRLLVVGVGTEGNTVGNAIPPNTVTYDGVAMTMIDHIEYTGGSPGTYNDKSLWYLLAPNIGTANVVCTWLEAPDKGASAGAISLYNVAQQAYEVKAEAMGDDQFPTVDIITVTADAWIIDVAGSNVSTQEMTAGANQTRRYYEAASQITAGSTEPGGAAGNHTMSWTMTSGEQWGIVAAAFAEASSWTPVTDTFTARVINSFDSSGIDTDIFGLTFDGRNLWVGGNDSQAIYEVDRLGNIISSFDTAAIADSFTGLVYIDGSLWAIDATNSYLIHFSLTGVVRQTIDLSGFQGTLYGLDFDGKYFWLCDVTNQAIYQLDTNGVLIKTITTTYTDSKGVSFYRKNLLVSDETKRCLEIYDRLGNVIGAFDFDPIDSAPRAMTFDGKYFWIAGNENDYIYQIVIEGL